MKDLSIEEKAKAYDEAIKRAKAMIPVAANQEEIYNSVITIFPELKESEDEKIRKWLIGYLENRILNCSLIDEKENCKTAVAWLEKQGEHANFLDKIQIGDKVTRNKDGVLVNLSQLKRVAKKDEKQGKNNMGISEATKKKLEDNLNKALEKETPESWNKFLEGEQKPTDKVEPKFKVGDVMRTLQEASDGFTDGMPVVVSIDEEYYHCNNELIAIKDQDDYEYPPMNRRQKPADLPKGEDYGIDSLYHAARILEKTLGEVDGYESDDGILEHKCAIEAVNRLYKQKPAWSEEEEYLQAFIIELLYGIEDTNDKEYEKKCRKAADWLKSLRPQNSWKPSVEEVVALEHAINCYSGISPTNANEVFILEIMKERLKNLTK